MTKYSSIYFGKKSTSLLLSFRMKHDFLIWSKNNFRQIFFRLIYLIIIGYMLWLYAIIDCDYMFGVTLREFQMLIRDRKKRKTEKG